MKKRWISAVMALVLVISSGAVLQTGRSAAEEILDLETDEEDCWQTEQDGEENALEDTQEETETVSDGGGLQIETIEEETESDLSGRNRSGVHGDAGRRKRRALRVRTGIGCRWQ